MLFLNRRDELGSLDGLAGAGGGLAVIWGRRRLGKTRLLLEWCTRRKGLYTIADQSSPETQRAYLARAAAGVLPGFADVVYPDWARLLTRLAADAAARGFRGPFIIDELPSLVAASPDLPSVLQRWIDHDAKEARLLETIDRGDPLRGDADTLTATIQSSLLATVPAQESAGEAVR